MAILQALTNQGRVVGGHLASGSVLSGHGGLTIQHPRNPFKRHKLNAETVLEWEEGSDAGSGDRFGHAAWRAGVVMTVSNSMGVSRPSEACLRRRW